LTDWKIAPEQAIFELLNGRIIMRQLLAFSAILAGLAPAPAFAQILTGSRDGTTNVTSDRIGMPGNTTDPLSQYQTQRAMNNLPGPDARVLASLGSSRPAKSAELTAGATVNDKAGKAIAKIDQVDADGVVVSTAKGKVKIPADAFGHNRAGLLLDMTEAQFDQIVGQANAGS
jgi:hypothetical protein